MLLYAAICCYTPLYAAICHYMPLYAAILPVVYTGVFLTVTSMYNFLFTVVYISSSIYFIPGGQAPQPPPKPDFSRFAEKSKENALKIVENH